MSRNLAFAVLFLSLTALRAHAEDVVLLFDGKSFAGWNGDTEKTWRIENGVIAAGRADAPAPRNEFLATNTEYENFELRLEYKIECTAGCNAGVQFRSQRVPNHHEVSGFQADIGPEITGALYDESRRNRMLAVPPQETQEKALALAKEGWNVYVIRCEGPRIQLSINGVPTIDYTETDPTIPMRGVIALQIHGGLVGAIRYRNIRIQELPAE
jgi:hypothetical protein